MNDRDRTYVTILESEIEELKTKLNEPSIWEPTWKTFPANENRFDLMVANLKLATVTKYPHENIYQVSIIHQYVPWDEPMSKSLDEIKQIIIDTITRTQV
jgi:hypothetical protein